MVFKAYSIQQKQTNKNRPKNPNQTCVVFLKDKLSHVKFFRSFFAYTSVGIRQHQPEVVRRAPPTGMRREFIFYREDMEAKQGNYLHGCDLSSCPSLRKPYLAAWGWFLSFIFSGLGFGYYVDYQSIRATPV